MQLYAFDLEGNLINAQQALRQTDYQCLECQQVVRLRGGPQRQRHFYHIEPTPFCRQHQKGAVHLQLQSYFYQALPAGDCQLEHSFPSIGRIADVVWFSQKIVFEIQCSPISAEEVLGRNRDYQQIGWQVVWILHDQRYNQIRLSAAELALRALPHYFTNMDRTGMGIIYDQFDICDKGLRLARLHPLPIDVQEMKRGDLLKRLSFPLTLMQHRLSSWRLSFAGDLLSSFASDSQSDYWKQAIKMEKQFLLASRSFQWRHLPVQIWQKGIVWPYQVFFRFILERMCR